MVNILFSKSFLTPDVNLAVLAAQVSLLVSTLVISTLIQVLFPADVTQTKSSYIIEMKRNRAIKTATSLNKLAVLSILGIFISLAASSCCLALLDIGSLLLAVSSITLFGRLVVQVNNDIIKTMVIN